MTRSLLNTLMALTLVLISVPAIAEDRAIDRDWRTGVTVAPGAMTWTSDNFENKKGLINDTAKAEGKTCTAYAFLGWPASAGATDAIMQKTRAGYEAAGYSVTQKQGEISTDTVWTVAKDGREAVVLWGAVMGSTIYLSCITAGAPATDPDAVLWIGVLCGLGLIALVAGLWLIWRVRAQSAAAQTWPIAAGTIRSSEVQTYKTKGGKQYMAKVAYDYAVDGASFTGDRLRFSDYARALSAAEADVAKYSVGAPVEVLYDPQRPQQATLEAATRGYSVLGLVLALTGGLLAAVGALIALLA